MIITFSGDEVKSAFACKLKDLGLTNINEESITVTVKAIRDGSGSAEATVEFVINSSEAAQPTPTEQCPSNPVSGGPALEEVGIDPAKDGRDDTLDSSEQISDIFKAR